MGEEKRREEEYNYNYITITRKPREFSKGKKWHILHIYVNKENEILHDKLCQVLDREGGSLTKWFWSNAKDYVRLHELGNPQQRLDTILKLGRPYRAPSSKCGYKGCKNLGVTVGTFIQNGKSYALCDKHLERAKQSGNWKFL